MSDILLVRFENVNIIFPFSEQFTYLIFICVFWSSLVGNRNQDSSLDSTNYNTKKILPSFDYNHDDGVRYILSFLNVLHVNLINFFAS